MINFLPPQARLAARRARLKRLVFLPTTVVLVIYVVGLVGFLGWWFFLKQTGQRTSQQESDLSGQVAGLAGVETLVWHVDNRLKVVTQALANRPSVARELARLDPAAGGVTVVGLSYQAGAQQVTVVASGAAQIEDYATGLTADFGRVKLDLLERRATGTWQGVISLEGGRP